MHIIKKCRLFAPFNYVNIVLFYCWYYLTMIIDVDQRSEMIDTPLARPDNHHGTSHN